MGWKALWNGDGEGEKEDGEGRKTEKNLQVIEKEMGKGGRMEMEGTFVSRERTMETRKQGPPKSYSGQFGIP